MDELCLSQWCGWQKHGEDRPDTPQLLPSDGPGKSLPAMLRRRLDDAGRATCDILASLDSGAELPLLHASRHGDATRTLAMLHDLIAGEALSPTRFSLSVHNATLGIHSIARQHQRPLQALSACGNEFDALLSEARGYLAEGYPAVVIAFTEGDIPKEYLGHTEHPGKACAVGMRLSLNEGHKLVAGASGSSLPRPTPIDIIGWLCGAGKTPIGRHGWTLA